MQVAEVAGPPEPLGQDMLQHQPQELHAGHRAPGPLAGLAVSVAECHGVPIHAQNILLGDHAPVQIATKIDDRLRTRTHLLAVDHPFHRRVGRHAQAGMRHGIHHLGAKHLSQGFFGKQILALLGAPALVAQIDRPGRHHQMHMRMEIQPPVMGVQHRHGAGMAL